LFTHEDASMLPPFDDDELLDLPDLPDVPGLSQIMAEAVAAARRDLRDPNPKVAINAARMLLSFCSSMARSSPRDRPRKTVYVYVHPERPPAGAALPQKKTPPGA
jgi:hypothetical protein